MPINNFNYCPKCGYKGLIWKNERNFFCNACSFTYYHNQAAAVCVIISCKGKILFTERKKSPAKGTLDLPGGFVDPKETAAQAAIREIKEEVGLDLSLSSLSYFDTSYNDYPYKGVLYKTLDIAFRTEIKDEKEVFIGDKKEISQTFWMNPKEIDLKKIGFFSIQTILENYIKFYG